MKKKKNQIMLLNKNPHPIRTRKSRKERYHGRENIEKKREIEDI